MNTIQLEVQGMRCGGCAKRVTDTLQSLNGVRTVDVDLASGHVRVQGNLPEGGDSLVLALTAAGYPAMVCTVVTSTSTPTPTPTPILTAVTKKSGGCCG